MRSTKQPKPTAYPQRTNPDNRLTKAKFLNLMSKKHYSVNEACRWDKQPSVSQIRVYWDHASNKVHALLKLADAAIHMNNLIKAFTPYKNKIKQLSFTEAHFTPFSFSCYQRIEVLCLRLELYTHSKISNSLNQIEVYKLKGFPLTNALVIDLNTLERNKRSKSHQGSKHDGSTGKRYLTNQHNDDPHTATMLLKMHRQGKRKVSDMDSETIQDETKTIKLSL